jgi:hypothetical protein
MLVSSSAVWKFTTSGQPSKLLLPDDLAMLFSFAIVFCWLHGTCYWFLLTFNKYFSDMKFESNATEYVIYNASEVH